VIEGIRNWIKENTPSASQTPLLGKGEFNPNYKHLPIDTKYFKDLELEILGLFDDLDDALDGWLIKSENYQALKTILPKFKEKVQTIYIDPPFNKGQDADYFYSVKYKDSSWITLLENRLQLARDILNPKGSIFVRCDYNGNMYVRMLMNEVFGEENFLNDLIVARITKKGFGANRYPTANDYLFWYSKTEKYFFEEYRKSSKTNKEKWHSMDSMSGGRGTGEPRIILGKLRYPPTNRVWTFSQKRIYEMEKQCLIKLNSKGTPIYKVLSQEGEPLDSNWMDIPGYSFSTEFQTENSEILLKRVIESTSNTPSANADTPLEKGNRDIVMDFFLGSGTTTAVAHKLKRKWLGVEMGEHFYTVVLPRMKKVLAYDKSGISKEKEVKEKYNQNNAGGFFKYYELEQYEDALRKVKYEDSNLFENPYQDPYNQYVFMRDLKMLSALEIDYENNKVKVDLSKLYPDPSLPLRTSIDISETLSNLLGRWIKKITADVVEFEDGEKINVKNLDYKLVKPLIWW
jgi:adenine specific DNA methylase Mod